MPPKTRKPRTSTSGPAQKGTQKTLAFSNSRISKSTSSPAGKDIKLEKSTPPPAHKAIKLEDQSTPEPVDVKVEAPLKAEVEAKAPAPEHTPDELAALKVSDAQIRKYWKAREAERLAARVHQEGLSVEEKVLRLFDMSSQFGPCIGTARKSRWARAQRLNLSPPIEVLAVLLKEEERGNKGIERAYVDELMGSKALELASSYL